MAWLGATETYSLYYTNGTLTIFDKRLNDHMPISLKGEEAADFLKQINRIPMADTDDKAFEKIDALCEGIKQPRH